MALWAGKYVPKSIDNLDYNVRQLNILKQMVSKNDFPHLLFCGPDGCGKRTRIACLLSEIYGEGTYQMRHIKIPFATSAGKPMHIVAADSKYHLEVRPSDVGFHDRVVVQTVIKEMASQSIDESIFKKPFKIVVMHEADLLSFDAQQALRRTMEKYAGSCKIFLCCTSLNRIIDPLISRCMVIRLPAPSKNEIVKILMNTAKNESVENRITENFYHLVAEKSKRNLRRALLTLEASVVGNEKDSVCEDEKNLMVPEWQTYCRSIAKKIMATPTIEGFVPVTVSFIFSVSNVRPMLFEIVNRLIPVNMVFEYLVEELAAIVDDSKKLWLYATASKYQNMSLGGDKPVVYLEGFILNFIAFN